MNEPQDLVKPQQAVAREEPAAPPTRQVTINDLLETLASTARERAEAAREQGDKEAYRRVARLARELVEALADVPDGARGAERRET